jgi:hypothetical protein
MRQTEGGRLFCKNARRLMTGVLWQNPIVPSPLLFVLGDPIGPCRSSGTFSEASYSWG